MNSLETINASLPANIEDLSKFVLVGREKLTAVRAEINAIKKVGLAKEVLEQKKAEAQEIAELVTLSEVKIGAMLREIPKATTNHKKADLENRTDADFLKPKREVIAEIGIKPDTAERFQKMAEHEDIVHEAIKEARQNDDIVSRASVLKKIAEAEHKPHIVNNSGDNEWYTPAEYIETARRVLGKIDLDPASNNFANKTVKAGVYYTEESNGLEQVWFGNIWLNPPYSSSLIQQFAEKLISSDFEQAIVLVNNATETQWFRALADSAAAVVFPTGRIRYEKTDGAKNTPLQGQAFLYFGAHPQKFLEEFKKYGWGARL